MLPVLQSTLAGIESVPEPAREAAEGLGLSPGFGHKSCHLRVVGETAEGPTRPRRQDQSVQPPGDDVTAAGVVLERFLRRGGP